MNINLAEAHITQNLGIGKRFAFWVQGCPFTCKGCISPNWIPFEVNKVISVEDLAKQILEIEGIEGITISGGEPMMQAGRLAKVLEIVCSQKTDLNVIVFTGFEQKQLIWEDAQVFLKYIDVLITGLYIEKQNDNQGLRGSSNQKIIFLTDRLKPYEDYFYHRKRDLEYHIQSDGVLMIGIPEKDYKIINS
jgi:anaerobic ribonucleoside-triphosphate reductase activating protein